LTATNAKIWVGSDDAKRRKNGDGLIKLYVDTSKIYKLIQMTVSQLNY